MRNHKEIKHITKVEEMWDSYLMLRLLAFLLDHQVLNEYFYVEGAIFISISAAGFLLKFLVFSSNTQGKISKNLIFHITACAERMVISLYPLAWGAWIMHGVWGFNLRCGKCP